MRRVQIQNEALPRLPARPGAVDRAGIFIHVGLTRRRLRDFPSLLALPGRDFLARRRWPGRQAKLPARNWGSWKLPCEGRDGELETAIWAARGGEKEIFARRRPVARRAKSCLP